MTAPAPEMTVDEAHTLAAESRRLGAEILALLDDAERTDPVGFPELLRDLFALVGLAVLDDAVPAGITTPARPTPTDRTDAR